MSSRVMDRRETPDILGDIMAATVNVAQETRGALVWVPLGRVYDNPFQPRQSYSDEETRVLADNIWSMRNDLPATMGLQQPPVARVVYFAPGGDETPIEREMYNDPAAVRQRLCEVATAAGRVEPEIGMVATALAAQSPMPQPEPVEGGEWWRHWEDNWSDDDEAAYQDLIMGWDGRAWQSLAAKATKLVYEQPLAITPAVLQRLAQECPDVTLSGHFGRMAREWQAVAA